MTAARSPAAPRAPIIRNHATFDLPVRPRLLSTLAAAVESEAVTVEHISELIESDPGLSGAIVKSSNSAALSRGRPVTSVREAVHVLGLKNLIALATAAFVRRAFPSNTPEITKLWERSTQMAEACAQISMKTGVTADVAYTFGLFRFVGCAVLILQAPAYKKTFEGFDTPEFGQAERIAHGITHAQMGAGLVVKWGMSQEMTQAVSQASDLVFLENISMSDAARRILAVGALAQMQVMPASVRDCDALTQACHRVLA